ncbi:TPA: HNH endonuclease [Serratia marcescens]
MANHILSEYFSYDPTSPSFLRWKINICRRIKAGYQVGSISSYGYYRTKLNGKEIAAHRVVWQLHNGEIPEGMQIDHIDGTRVNNDISNLRLASVSENLQNQKLSTKNATGIKGLSWCARYQYWRGSIQKHGKRIERCSKDKAVIENWLISMRKNLHGEFARHK